MHQVYKSAKVKFYVGDVRDYSSVSQAMHSLDFVFHAAALKQVPSWESYPMEAVKTNVMGTENVLEAAIQADVEKVTYLCTDKAVCSINAMGMSKVLMEKWWWRDRVGSLSRNPSRVAPATETWRLLAAR